MPSLSLPTGAKGRISVDRFNAILAQTTPLAVHLGIRAELIGDGEAWSSIAFGTAALRSGGTYSGPALMALIDVCMYAAVLSATGEDPKPQGSGSPYIVPYGAYRTADSMLIVTAGNNGLLEKLLTVVDHPECRP